LRLCCASSHSGATLRVALFVGGQDHKDAANTKNRKTDVFSTQIFRKPAYGGSGMNGLYECAEIAMAVN